MTRYALIMAGGAGLRMATEVPKQFLLLDGRPILMRTISSFYQYGNHVKIIVVLPQDQINYWERLCKQYKFDIPHEIVPGGVERFYSVRNGLERVMYIRDFGDKYLGDEVQRSSRNDLVAVHDAVRPLVSTTLIENSFKMAEKRAAVVPTMPLVDSIRRKMPSGKSRAEDRRCFCCIQTPQVFRLIDLWAAYQQVYREDFTDEASVMDAAGYPVYLMEGERKNIKITMPEDLELAEFWLKQS